MYMYTHFYTMKKKKPKENIVGKGEIAQNCSICILKSFISHISIVVYSFFEFWTITKWGIKEWVK